MLDGGKENVYLMVTQSKNPQNSHEQYVPKKKETKVDKSYLTVRSHKNSNRMSMQVMQKEIKHNTNI